MMSVRRYSRAQAEAEAIRLAKALVAGSGLLLLGASPDSRLPAARAGKVPVRWVVLFQRPGAEGRWTWA